MAHNISNISYKTLVDYAEGRLSDTERDAVAAQLQANPDAIAEVTELQHLFTLMRSDASVDAPAHVMNRAARLLRQRNATQPEQSSLLPRSLLRRVLAALTFDSASTLALGMRSGASQTRQLMFTAQGVDLDVRIATQGDEVTVSGQVLGPDAQGMAVLANSVISITAQLNALSEFVLPPVPSGRYLLTLHYGNAEIVLPELELGASHT